MLKLEEVSSAYGDSRVLHDLTLEVREGEVVSLLGRNGAGKTTTLLTIMGHLRPSRGRVLYAGVPLNGLRPHAIARKGVGFVPQEREIFSSLTVRENLTVAARIGPGAQWTLDTVYERFPRLKERERNLGFQLSGGEQQMLAIARALMLNPRFLLLDEPSEGLAPLLVEEIIRIVRDIRRTGLSILIVEQNLGVALDVADRHYILHKGSVGWSGTSDELAFNEDVKTALLAV